MTHDGVTRGVVDGRTALGETVVGETVVGETVVDAAPGPPTGPTLVGDSGDLTVGAIDDGVTWLGVT